MPTPNNLQPLPARTPAAVPTPPERPVSTNVRLCQRHITYLREEAMRRATQRGSNRLDLSEVLRDVLDERLRR